MLTDPKAVTIIRQARQKNVAAARRSSRDFDHILADFFPGRRRPGGFDGEVLLDLGPGQYDFARIVRECGGTCENIDNDPAVIELGRYLGLTVHDANLRSVDLAPFAGRFDGLFCKFSINAFWHREPDLLVQHVRALDGVVKPGGWGWIAPWNGRPRDLEESAAHRLLDAQIGAFEACGWLTLRLTPAQADRYGINGRVDNNVIYLRNLKPPRTERP